MLGLESYALFVHNDIDILHNAINIFNFAETLNDKIEMAQVSMTVRMDSNLKASFDNLCSQFGMSANAAMNVFARAVVQRGKIPFEVMSDETAAKAQAAIDKIWAEKNLDVDSLLNEHLRTTYKHASEK